MISENCTLRVKDYGDITFESILKLAKIEDIEKNKFYDIESYNIEILTYNTRTRKCEYQPIKYISYKGELTEVTRACVGNAIVVEGQGFIQIYDPKKNKFLFISDIKKGWLLRSSGQHDEFETAVEKRVKFKSYQIQVENQTAFVNDCLIRQ